MRAPRAVAVVLLATLLAGCSMVRIGYEHADWLILHELEGYVDLDSAQHAALAAALAKRMHAHRRDELGDTLALMRRARAELAAGLRRDRLTRLFEDLRRTYRRAVVGTLPAVVPTLASLTPDQVHQLAASFTERDREYRDEYLPDAPAERQRRRAERVVEHLEDWTGRLDDAQRALVAARVARVPHSAEAWFAWRRTMQGRLVALLRRGASPAEVEALLTAWFVDPSARPATLRATIDAAERAWIDLLVALDRTLTDAQRKRAVHRIDGWVAALAPLVGDPRPRPVRAPPPRTPS